MTGTWIPIAAWKWLICMITAMSALLLLVEVRHGFNVVFIQQKHGTVGGTLGDHIGLSPESQGAYSLPILSLSPGSPLLAHGAEPGDLVRYDRPLDRWRRFQIGEPIGLSLIRDGSAKHLTIRAVASPVPFAEAFDYVASAIMAVSALLFSFLVGVKQGGGNADRALSMTFFGLSLIFFITMNYSPHGPVFFISKLLALGIYPLIWYWSLSFALKYQPDVQGQLRRVLDAFFPWYGVLAFGTAVYAVWYGLGNDAPWMLPLTGAVVVLGMTMAIVGTVEGWRQASGEMRQRLRWLLLSFAAGSIPALLAWVPAIDATVDGMRWTTLAMFIGQFAMYIGLAYAVLKHRVFNFDFAVSRMAVFSVLSVLLLTTFFIVKHLFSSILKGGGHAEAPPGTVLVDGLIALGVYLLFHHLHGRVERRVEHFFFRDWHDNEHKLRQFLRQAPYITAIDALISSARSAIDRFTSQAGCAIYLREPDGSYVLTTHGTLDQAPGRIEPNHMMAVALRGEAVPLRYDRLQSGLPAELALPMSHRGVLTGFMLIGTKPSRDDYRPDEVEVLGYAAQQIGLDLHAIRVEVLENKVGELVCRVALQEQQMQLISGRRRTRREPQGGSTAVVPGLADEPVGQAS